MWVLFSVHVHLLTYPSPSRASWPSVGRDRALLRRSALVRALISSRHWHHAPVSFSAFRQRFVETRNRDLKPDNILLDEKGNAHLTDFNIAVHFGERKLTGVAGSMAYMAPEYVRRCLRCPLLTRIRILAKRGYTYCIDWWSLGICTYELIFGRRPFRGRTNADLTYSISKDPLKWPEDAEKKCTRTGMHVIKGVGASPPRT